MEIFKKKEKIIVFKCYKDDDFNFLCDDEEFFLLVKVNIIFFVKIVINFICYNCNRERYMKNYVYFNNEESKSKSRNKIFKNKWKKEKKKLKKITGICSDENLSEDLSNEEEEEINICFMVRDNKVYLKFFFILNMNLMMLF